jgi:hypothetical protein
LRFPRFWRRTVFRSATCHRLAEAIHSSAQSFKQLPALRAALAAHKKETNSHAVAQNAKAA